MKHRCRTISFSIWQIFSVITRQICILKPPHRKLRARWLNYFSKGRTASHSFPIHFRDRPRTPLPLTYTLYERERALFGPWRKGEEMKEERRRELVFICLKLECSCVSCQCEDCITAVPVAVAKLSLKPVQNQSGLCEITIKTTI